jgi:hypothetical protein
MVEKKKKKICLTLDEVVIEKIGRYAEKRERSISWCINDFVKQKLRIGQYNSNDILNN